METNVDSVTQVNVDCTDYKLSYCKCLSKICGCDLNSQLTKGFADSLLEYFNITDIMESFTIGQRLNVIHLWGTANQSTKDLEKWLSQFMPFEIEWINDYSCNLVFNSMTESFVLLENYTDNYVFDNDGDLSVVNESERYLHDGIWRQVTNLPDDSEKMFMRFADKNDVKVRGAGKDSRFYELHGNPRYNNIKGISSKSLREKRKRTENSDSNSTGEDLRLVAYDDLPVVDLVGESTSSDIASDEDEREKEPIRSSSEEAEEEEDEEHAPAKRRKMISTMKLYSDRIVENSARGRDGSGRMKMDSGKKSVHSRLG